MLNSNITAILNLYRRPHLIQRQIDSLLSQTVPPDEIWLWKNWHEDNKDIDLKSFNGIDVVFDNHINWKYVGRLACAALVETDYIAMFDDDTIPGNKWLESCLSHHPDNELRILGSAGVILRNNKYFGHERVGWKSENNNLLEVDLVGHAWFFHKAALGRFWIEDPLTRDTGEDIHLSYTAQKFGGINTFCPPHPKNNKDIWGSLDPTLGRDDKTISVTNRPKFFGLRDACVTEYINRGWRPLFIRHPELVGKHQCC